MDLSEIARLSHENSVQHGFWSNTRETCAECGTLIVSESSIGYGTDYFCPNRCKNTKPSGTTVNVPMTADEIRESIPRKLRILRGEVDEAIEVYANKGSWPQSSFEPNSPPMYGLDKPQYEGNGKPVGLDSELADVIIMACGLAHAIGIDIEKAVLEKQQYNTTRAYRHGK